MKHFQDEDNDSMKDYETNVTNHYDENSDDWEGSLEFRHWREEKDNEDSEDWEGSLGFRHWRED